MVWTSLPKSPIPKGKNNRVLFLIFPPNSYPRKPDQTQSQPLPFISVQLASRVLSKPNLSLSLLSLSLCAKTLDLSRPLKLGAPSSHVLSSPILDFLLSLSSGKNPNPNPNFSAIMSDTLFAFVLLC